MISIRKSLYLLLLFFSVSSFSESLINEKNNLISEEFSLINERESLIDTSKTMFDSEKLLIEKNSLDNSSENIINTSNGLGVYNAVVQHEKVTVIDSVKQDSIEISIKSSYLNGYQEYLETITSIDPKAKHKFAAYYSDWQWNNKDLDFIKYSVNRAENERQVELCYDKAVKNFGIGTAVVGTTWIVSYIVPGGTIYQAAILVITKSTTFSAISGGAIGAITSASIGLVQKKTDEELICDIVGGSSEGYLVGAITGFVEGFGNVYKLSKESIKLKDFSRAKTLFDNKVFDSKGKKIGDYYPGDVITVDGRKLHLAKNVKTAGDKSTIGISYKYYLADDGKGNYFKVLMPDFDEIKIVNKTYKVPQYVNNNGKIINLYKNDAKLKKWCREQYLKDLKNSNFLKREGISKQEALLRIKFEEEGIKFFDYDSKIFKDFISKNNITIEDVYDFLDNYDRGEWHHLASSGEMIYVQKGHGSTYAPHTGGNKFWCDQAEIQINNGKINTIINKKN